MNLTQTSNKKQKVSDDKPLSKGHLHCDIIITLHAVFKHLRNRRGDCDHISCNFTCWQRQTAPILVIYVCEDIIFPSAFVYLFVF